MKNNSNFLIAIVFLLVFVFFWDAFVMSRYGSAPSGRPAAPDTSSIESKSAAQPLSKEKESSFKQSEVGQPERKKIVLRGPNEEVEIDTLGARVVSWKWKEESHWVQLVDPRKASDPHPLDLFPELAYSARKLSEREALFVAKHPDGFHVTKALSLDSPFHTFTVSCANVTDSSMTITSALVWGGGISKHDAGTSMNDKDRDALQAEQRAVALKEQIRSWKPGFIFNRQLDVTEAGPYKWAGVDNNYFLATFLPHESAIEKVHVSADRNSSPVLSLPIDMELGAHRSEIRQFRLYVGPKKFDDLKSLGSGLEKSVDFGFFGVIAKMLLVALHFFQNLTGNFGWAIVLLTLCVQVVVLPLTKKSLQHSIRMKELQPQLKKIQEQFKSDPKRMQIETLNLYKKQGMKFMGMEGCFPVLLQIPVFIAFYATLRVAYELRGAPWIFWIKDLSAHDPYYVLPILMGAGMFVQQKVTSVSIDPAQARMMMFMPIIFTFMFLQMPSGLVLYWLINSMTTIVVQKIFAWQKTKELSTAA